MTIPLSTHQEIGKLDVTTLGHTEFYALVDRLANEIASQGKKRFREDAKLFKPDCERDMEDLGKITNVDAVGARQITETNTLLSWCDSVGRQAPKGFSAGRVVVVNHEPDEDEAVRTVCIEGCNGVTIVPVLDALAEIFSNGKLTQVTFFDGGCPFRDALVNLNWSDPEKLPGEAFEFGGSVYKVEAVLA